MKHTHKEVKKIFRIAILSDTHMPMRAKNLPDELIEELKKVDLILHAGDFVSKETYEKLNSMGIKMEGVCGNMDEPALCKILPEHKIIEIEGRRIALTHGSGSPFNLPISLLKKYSGEKIDCLVFGHTHKPYNKVLNGILCFNPGSPTDRVFSIYRTYGLLEIYPTGIKGMIKQLA
ncbi:MAG: metallophosphoesterase [Elusimicrobiota bacterium]